VSTTDLRIPLTALPGLDATGLSAWAADERWLVAGDGGHKGVDLIGWGLSDVAPMPRAIVALDLADASTRDRVARWAARRVGLEVGSTAPAWFHCGYSVWALAAHLVSRRFSPTRLPESAPQVVGVNHQLPSLWSVDPTDDTRLPDGSRLVDAVALARVAVHLGHP